MKIEDLGGGMKRFPKFLRSRVAGIAAICLMQFHPGPALAQSHVASSQSSAICMRAERFLPGEENPVAVAIVVPQMSESVMAEQGFSALPCEEAFSSTAAQIRWRDDICALAAMTPVGALLQAQKLLGEHPAVFCGMAEIALGPWRRTSGADVADEANVND